MTLKGKMLNLKWLVAIVLLLNLSYAKDGYSAYVDVSLGALNVKHKAKSSDESYSESGSARSFAVKLGFQSPSMLIIPEFYIESSGLKAKNNWLVDDDSNAYSIGGNVLVPLSFISTDTFTPFVGGGMFVGWQKTNPELKKELLENDDYVIFGGAKIIAGSFLKINERLRMSITFDASYRSWQDVEVTQTSAWGDKVIDTITTSTTTQSASIGLQYRF